MSELTETSKKGLKTRNIIIITLLAFVLPFSLWSVGYFKTSVDSNIFTYFKKLPGIIGNLSTLYAAVLGIEVVKSGVFSKWYPKSYGERKLNKILKDHKPLSTEKYVLLENYIHQLNQPGNSPSNQPQEKFKNEYYQCVYKLQDKSFDFRMAWNDFNFYSHIAVPTKREMAYLKRLREYVYVEVQKLHMENQKKTC